MKDLPILFSGSMVRAILDDRKTMTRRVVKPALPEQINPASVTWNPFNQVIQSHHDGTIVKCPYGQPGDRLWVRETWQYHLCCGMDTEQVHYRADGKACPIDGTTIKRWSPFIFMPRWASRITLEVTGTRVESLQKISEEDALAEGIEPGDSGVEGWGRFCYRKLWNSLNEKRG